MEIYLTLLIPIVIPLLFRLFFKHRISWIECSIPLAVSLIIVPIAKHSSVSNLTKDIEFLGALTTEARYYEDWDQRVSCSHPIFCTTSNGKTTTTYICGYEHDYDVYYHPAEYKLHTTIGKVLDTQKELYHRLVKQFGNENFLELNRSFHSNDGDLYVSHWDKSEDLAYPVVIPNVYENKIQCSKSVFNYSEVDTQTINYYDLYDYPKNTTYHQMTSILEDYSQKESDKRLKYLNGLFSQSIECRMWILLFKGKSREAGLYQEQLWKGGNQNEFNICIGVDSLTNKIQWAHVFSWTEAQSLKDRIKNFIESSDSLNLNELSEYLRSEVFRDFKKKSFEDFNYLSVEPTTKAVIITYIIVLIVTLACCIIAYHYDH